MKINEKLPYQLIQQIHSYITLHILYIFPGRKFSINHVRKRITERQKGFLRTLAKWHDSSSISSASHFLVMLSTVYDPAMFYTNEEYLA